MAFLKVLNVGQGDCLVMKHDLDCTFNGELFYTDFGPGNVDVTKEIAPGDKVHLIITHHHSDHIDGLKFFFNNFNQVSDITVPYCFNEIALIARAILNLKGIKSARNCSEHIDYLNDITGSQIFLKTLLDKFQNKINIVFAYEGMRLCNHFEFLNPPLPYIENKTIDEIQQNNLKSIFLDLFEEEFASNMVNYVISVNRGYGIDHNFGRYFLYNYYYSNNRNDQIRATKAGCNLVLNYFLNNHRLFKSFNSSPNKNNMQKICDTYKSEAHDACIVMKAKYADRSYLLTGDASMSVFERLIDEGKDISAYYLKVPHHGSKNNLNDQILRAINPRIAIISHNNKCFGRAKDPHPNKKTIDLLRRNCVDILVTNAVVKQNNSYNIPKSKSRDDYLEIE